MTTREVGGLRDVPRHVAIIMDGNGRWAQRRGLPRTRGHHRGVGRVREVVSNAKDFGIEYLTLFAFSTENWRRPNYEVSVLMKLFKSYIVREVDDLDRAEVRVRFIGDRSGLPKDLQRVMGMIEARTDHHRCLTLQVALNYGSRKEITAAMQRLAAQVSEGALAPGEIDEARISEVLDTGGIPDPDLVIRTSGEKRVSNFLLWQAAYAEFAFVEECWPDFDREVFAAVLENYRTRERRFGAVVASG